MNLRSHSKPVKTPAPPAPTWGAFEIRGPGSVPPRPATQARSRKNVDLLLNAAEAVLSEKGLAAATVPAIAKRAGLSVGVVYRRFPDKDALLRAVYERVITRVQTQNRRALENPRLADVDLSQIMWGAVHGSLYAHRHHKGLLKALVTFAMTHDDPAFRRRAKKLSAETVTRFKELIRQRKDPVDHPDPAMAAAFGLLVVTLAIRAVVLFDEGEASGFLPPADKIGDELVRMYERYLGVRAPSSKTARS